MHLTCAILPFNQGAGGDSDVLCGVAPLARIIGGTEVNPEHKWPWQIYLQVKATRHVTVFALLNKCHNVVYSCHY